MEEKTDHNLFRQSINLREGPENANLLPPKHKKIWIDLDNSPHVPFFNPIIRELKKRGWEVIITARDCFQVFGLADLFCLPYSPIGRHYGKSKILKILGTLIRSFQMLPFALRNKPLLAISHGSRSQLLTALMLRIPSLVLIDYEHSKGLQGIKPTWIMAPDVIPDNAIAAPVSRVLRYPGLKEDVYVPEFQPDPGILRRLGIGNGDLLVTIRPPATEAHYHNPKSEKLFVKVVNFLGSDQHVRIVMLPRNNRKQTDWIRNTWPEWCSNGKIIIPDRVLNGLNLIWHSALVVSGGGTMNREAAALGVPVYSIFQGRIGAVDYYLSNIGRLILLKTVSDIPRKLRVSPRYHLNRPNGTNQTTLHKIVEHIEVIMINIHSNNDK